MTPREVLFSFVAAGFSIYAITKSKPETVTEFIKVETPCYCKTFDDVILKEAIADKNPDDLCPLWAEDAEYTHVDELNEVCSERYDDSEPIYREY